MNNESIIAERRDKTIYREGDAAVKIFGESYSKAEILNEALNLARVEETGLRVPKLREVGMRDGKWAITMDYIDGRTLAELLASEPSRTDELLELFTKLQLEIQSKRSPLLSRMHDKIRRKIGLTELDASTKYELFSVLDGMPEHSKLCHGDFNPSNIVIREDGAPYILDWSHVTQGNGAADAARSYLLFCLSGDTETADKYLREYSRLGNVARQYVRKWLPIVAASQSSKGKSEERELLSKWIDIVY